MEALNLILTDMFGPAGPLMAVGGLGFLLMLIAVPILFKRKADPLDKLRENQRRPHAAGSERQALRVKGGGDKLEKYSAFLEPKDAEEYSAMQLTLLQAGYGGKNAVRTYHFAQFALGIGLLLFGVLIVFLKSQNPNVVMTSTSKIMWILGPGIAGYMLPKYWITRRVESRKEEITNGFPDALDMMLVCVEAGQSLDQAIIRVANEIRAGYPALADEFQIVSHEVKAGKERVQVLRDMSERCGVTDVSSFVTVLIQSATFGTSIAEALRVFSAEMRDKRVMRAEEKANTLPTKMTLATMGLTVPPLLIILLGPSVYNIAQTLSKISF
ncbi:type II secretion system F family protein [Aliiroseovarius sp. KMU-50]|uniref:Type II secretion system F family protein n=1 Tax=Aliiroseovarius salicola TaxID=3009082 RepID=A0ABT4W0H8_9RHOB|nr:type II secretion system F family protein [Aliiroseovarius sp. KMU-50]MDA5094020.1 type II secretion system F family protein [Aliiroseovarius sp. KMU-50]